MSEPTVDAAEAALRARRDVWEREAEWWRSTFTDGADPEYELEILPIVEQQLAGARVVLDLGCGEGQVARRICERVEGLECVIGIDISVAQLANATSYSAEQSAAGVNAFGSLALVRGEGERLPFRSASFDAVVCTLVIEHTEDVDAVLDEVARVLVPGGWFLLLVNHPMFQGSGSGFVDDQILNETYWRVGPYLVEDVSWEEVDAGVKIPFAHRPLSRYINPLAGHDLVLTEMLEPRPLEQFLASSIDPVLESSIPRLLAMRFEHRPRTDFGRAGRGSHSTGRAKIGEKEVADG